MESPQVAFERAVSALKQGGSIVRSDEGSRTLSGRIVYGLQRVAVDVHVTGDERSSQVVVSAKSDDIQQIGAASALERMFQTMENINNPNFKPDRRGATTGGLIFQIVVFVVILIVVIGFINRRAWGL